MLAFVRSGRVADAFCDALFSVLRLKPASIDGHHNDKEHAMGKYFLAWLLGVPALVLVLIYFFMH